MKTVSAEMAQRLKDAGWEGGTAYHYVCHQDDNKWWLYNIARSWAMESGEGRWLPAPTLDEILIEVDLDDLKAFAPIQERFYDPMQWWVEFAEWLYTTMRDVEAASEVWLKVKGNHV